jgi:hypothetical protein
MVCSPGVAACGVGCEQSQYDLGAEGIAEIGSEHHSTCSLARRME